MSHVARIQIGATNALQPTGSTILFSSTKMLPSTIKLSVAVYRETVDWESGVVDWNSRATPSGHRWGGRDIKKKSRSLL
jgi:hypothetical protein